VKIKAWTVVQPGEPMVPMEREQTPGAGEVIVRVAGCGVCHTDLGFFYEGVPTRHGFPLALGHEISGEVVEAGEGAEEWLGRSVVVPAVIPCGTCAACREGKGTVCKKQIFPGNDVPGGFATHVCVPAHGLCPVPDLNDAVSNPAGVTLEELSVVADAVSTPYQAVHRSGLREGDLAVFVGVGGVGGFGVQIAAARGAHVVAIDTNPERLELMSRHGADLCLRADELDFKALKGQVRTFAGERGVPFFRHRIFETSGTPAGQVTAFGLVGPGAELSVVGFTPKKIEIRLSNLMAFDAVARGNWGCLPEHYPSALELVLQGRVALGPFVEKRSMATINETFEDLREHRVSRRVILIPES